MSNKAYLTKNTSDMDMHDDVTMIMDVYTGELSRQLQALQSDTSADYARIEKRVADHLHHVCCYFLLPLVRHCIAPAINRSESLVLTGFPVAVSSAGFRPDLVSDGIVRMSSVPMAFKKAVMVVAVPEFSAACIRDCCLASCSCKNVISEADPVYIQAVAGKKKCRHQLSLVYVQHLVHKAIMADPICRKVYAEHDLMNILTSGIGDSQSSLEIVMVYKILQAIFALEESVDTSRSKFERKLLKVRQENTIHAMDSIDELMKSAASYRCVLNADGSRKAREEDDWFAKAAALWLNQRKNFRIFLSDPHVSPVVPEEDNTSDLFRMFLSYAGPRSRHQFFVHDLCAVYSVLQTFERNHTDNSLFDYLLDYFQAMNGHLMSSLMLMQMRRAIFHEEQEQIVLNELNKDFNFDRWSPLRYRN